MSRSAGAEAEEKAVQYLAGLGYEILERNFRARTGEIDIVARDGESLVFVEVRSRARADFGSAGESVDGLKRRKIVRTASLYLQSRAPDAPARFDVIAFDSGTLRHITDAFDASGQ